MSKLGHADRMRRLVARWRASEESGASFARRHGVTPWTFWYWCRKVTEESAAAVPAFVPVHVVEPDVSAGVEIVLATGERLKVAAGASVDLVRTVVAAPRAAKRDVLSTCRSASTDSDQAHRGISAVSIWCDRSWRGRRRRED